MATDMKKGRFLSVEREIENGEKKRKMTCVGNFVSLILRCKRYGKTEPKLLVRLNRTEEE